MTARREKIKGTTLTYIMFLAVSSVPAVHDGYVIIESRYIAGAFPTF